MRSRESEIIKIKKLKKDGSIDLKIINNISSSLRNRNIVVLPIDASYGIVGIADREINKRILSMKAGQEDDSIILISSFKMLNDLAHFSKVEYDFLNRIWPGEVNVILRNREEKSEKNNITIGYPKSKFLQLIIEAVDIPLTAVMSRSKKNPIYKEADLVKTYKTSSDLIVLIEELCKKSPDSTLIDISKGELRIISEGKVSCEEIKSLYFLGKDDEAVY